MNQTKTNAVTKMKRFVIPVLGAVLLSCLPAISYAASNMPHGQDLPTTNYYVGADLGIAFANSGFGTKLNLGLMGGYNYDQSWGFGLFFNYVSLGSVVFSDGSSASDNGYLYGVETQYSIAQYLPGAYVGGRLGLETVSLSYNGTFPGIASNSSTYLVLGPKVGYDYPLGSGLSVGGMADYVFTLSSSGFNSFDILGVLKYGF